jgi:cytochrome c-type biogenesis protein CcmH
MIPWIVFTLMVAVAAVGITIPLVRRYDARRGRPAEANLLGQQIAQIDGQAAAEGLPAEDAEALRTETIRRFLAEPPPVEGAGRPLGGRSLLALAMGLAAIVAIGGAVLYTRIGRPDLATASTQPGGGAQGGDAGAAPNGHVGSMIAELEAKMRQSPNDAEGWRMLGWSYMQTGRFAESANAYGRAAALDPANADYKSAQGEALVKAADGSVTPEAQAAFAAAFKLDPTDPRARYFLAAAKDQAGDHAGAMNDWIALLKSAPPGAPWAAEVRGFVVRIAASRGEDVSSRLPPAPPEAQASAAGSGPTPDQVAAARQMPAGDQQAMIHSMVDRLAARLKTNPRDADGWVNLMRARMVLGDPTAATAAYRDAAKAFAGAPEQRAMLSEAARQMGVPGV